MSATDQAPSFHQEPVAAAVQTDNTSDSRPDRAFNPPLAVALGAGGFALGLGVFGLRILACRSTHTPNVYDMAIGSSITCGCLGLGVLADQIRGAARPFEINVTAAATGLALGLSMATIIVPRLLR
jgi:hypothetical protein